MLKKTLIAAGLAMAMMSGGATAQQAPQEVTFQLEATIKSPGLQISHRDGEKLAFDTKLITDNGHPKFEDLIKLNVKHPDSAVKVTVGPQFKLSHTTIENVEIPMKLSVVGGKDLIEGQATQIATAAETAGNGKDLDFRIEVADASKPAATAGIYNGSLSLMFELDADSATS